MPNAITLTTDFGSNGPYVAEMKGAILSVAPGVQLVDVSHDLAPQAVREAALFVEHLPDAFPSGTCHLVVVDPGVGTSRPMIAARWRDQFLVGPDNGVFSRLTRKTPPRPVVRLTCRAFWRAALSTTFHGRDVMGPVAAHLALGVAIERLGTPTTELVDIPWPAPGRQDDGQGSVTLQGEILWIDRFGNLLTNLEVDDLVGMGKLDNLKVQLMAGRHADRQPMRLVPTYASAVPGRLVALVGSRGVLEIAQVNGSAADVTGARVGDRVVVGRSADPL